MPTMGQTGLENVLATLALGRSASRGHVTILGALGLWRFKRAANLTGSAGTDRFSNLSALCLWTGL
jgi:hypothetical protein